MRPPAFLVGQARDYELAGQQGATGRKMSNTGGFQFATGTGRNLNNQATGSDAGPGRQSSANSAGGPAARVLPHQQQQQQQQQHSAPIQQQQQQLSAPVQQRQQQQQQATSNCVLVSRRQEGNAVLRHIRNVRWAFADLVPDYILVGRCSLTA